MKDQTCAKCAYAVVSPAGNVWCRRFPPWAGAVHVQAEGWCGEWRGKPGRPKKEQGEEAKA